MAGKATARKAAVGRAEMLGAVVRKVTAKTAAEVVVVMAAA